MRVVVAVLIAVLAVVPAATAEERLELDRVELAEWLTGVFDNTEQWLATDGSVPRLRMAFERSGDGGVVATVSRWDAGWRAAAAVPLGLATETGLDGIVMGRSAGDDPREPGATPPCAVVWHRDGAGFAATARGDACPPSWLPAAVPGAELRLDREGLELRRPAGGGDAVPQEALRLRRAVGYTGRAELPGGEVVGLELDDRGGTARLGGADDGGTPLSVRLSAFGPPVAPVRALRLELEAGGEVLAEALAGPSADRIGLQADGVRVRLERADGRDGGLGQLVEWMTGSFSSAAQAEADEAFRDVRLHVAPVWTDRDDAHWLYVEQAVAEYLDRPYRQRIYRVSEIAPDLYQSQVLTVPEPSAVVGAWRDPSLLAGLAPEDLEVRDGCAILLRRRGDAYLGSTLGRLCESTLRGAAYATSEVEISAEGMFSWDRGFDAGGSQVWGAEKGGYVFDRLAEEPAPAADDAAAP